MEELESVHEGSTWWCIRPKDHRGLYLLKKVMPHKVALVPLDHRLPRQQRKRTIILATARFLARFTPHNS